MYYLSGLSGAYTHTALKVDISSLSSTGFQSGALLIGQPDSPSSEGLFLQIVAEGVTGNFNRIELDTGVNMTARFSSYLWPPLPGDEFIWFEIWYGGAEGQRLSSALRSRMGQAMGRNSGVTRAITDV